MLYPNPIKDVHTELIQHRRSWMLKRGIVKGNLTVNSEDQRRNGSCPLMPEEVSNYAYSLSPSRVSLSHTHKK